MTGKTPRIYWDSCIFLALIKGEKLTPDIDAAISDAAEAADEGKLTIVTSVLTRAEVLDAKWTKAEADRFTTVLDQGVVEEYVIDQRIAGLASQIRSGYVSRVPPISVKTPDSLHLATAIIAGVEEMWTLDGTAKHSRPGHLLRLSGSKEISGLKTTVPHSSVGPLLEDIPTIPVNAPGPVDAAAPKATDTKAESGPSPQVENPDKGPQATTPPASPDSTTGVTASEKPDVPN